MKRILLLLITLILSLSLISCAKGVETDYASAIMANGIIYYKSIQEVPAETAEAAIIGYTSSYTDTFPKKDGETNFNRELNMPYAKIDGGLAVLVDDTWYLCNPAD